MTQPHHPLFPESFSPRYYAMWDHLFSDHHLPFSHIYGDLHLLHAVVHSPYLSSPPDHDHGLRSLSQEDSRARYDDFFDPPLE